MKTPPLSQISAMLLLLLSLSCGDGSGDTSQTPVLALVSVGVIDIGTGGVSPDMTVLVRGDRISAVAKTGELPVPDGAQAVDASGKFLIPGLWDMHVHLSYTKELPLRREVMFPLLLANGITGVRDMGSDLEEVLAWREDIERGIIPGPRIITAGPMLDGATPLWPSSLAITEPSNVRQGVDSLARQGVDFLKVQWLLPRDSYFAVADQARRLQLPFAGHIPFSITGFEAVDAGQSSTEHVDDLFLATSSREVELKQQLLAAMAGGQFSSDPFLLIQLAAVKSHDEARAEELFSHMAARGTWHCPTLYLLRISTTAAYPILMQDERLRYIPPSWKEGYWQAAVNSVSADLTEENLRAAETLVGRHREFVVALQDAGVRLLAGTDTPGAYVIPGFSLHDELVEMVHAGLTPVQALRAATIEAAEYLGLSDSLGAIESDKLADLVLLDANPLDDIRNTQRIHAVIVRGSFLDRGSLDTMLAGVRALSGAPVESVR